jgi:MSHA pilin protein MshC
LSVGAAARGFTIVELVTVMVVVGVLGALGVSRLAGSNVMAGSAYHDELVSALRYAQKTAVSHRRVVCVTVGASTTTLTIAAAKPGAGCNLALPLPDNSGNTVASRDAAVLASTATLYFQPAGAITSDFAGLSTAAGTITVSGEAPIAYQGATGYVE